MQAIIHYFKNQILVQDIVNLSVTEKQGLVLEFRQEKAVDYYAEKLKKAKIPIILKGGKTISIDTTGLRCLNNDDVKVAVKKGDLISNEETINLDHPKLIKAPTYAEAIDALSIAGLKINIAYNKGFMYFKGELAGTGNKDMAIAPEHLEDQWLEDGIINACDLLKHYQDINCK